VHLSVIWLLVGDVVPGINESHYLPKAKHLFQPDFAARDLFIASGNAHWLFSLLAGGLSLFLSLPAVAWVGRLAAWLALAVAWQRLMHALTMPRPVRPLALVACLLAILLGNWSGEWAVGGFEGKAFAYPCVFWALALVVEARWRGAWIWLAAAVAFHPLVGAWAGLSVWLVWLVWGRAAAPLRQQWAAWSLAGCISLIGILPAVMMLGGPARSGDVVTAQIHAFFRLAHHQSPHLFHLSQHLAGGFTLACLAVTTLLAYRHPGRSSLGEPADSVERARWLLRVAWMAVAISGVGLLIDVGLVPLRPDIAAGLLRFYWFRWFDVAVPLAWTATLWCGACELARMRLAPSASDPSSSDPSSSDPAYSSVSQGRGEKRLLRWLPLTGLTLLSLTLAARQAWQQSQSWVPPADRSLLLSGNSRLQSGPEVIDDWQAVCAWIREHTPADSLFLTPRAQQTFKWYAGRAEVVSYKDVPQDGPALLIWYDRLQRTAPPRSAAGEPLGWTTPQLRQLQERYGFEYVLVDRRIQREPPLLELVYPSHPSENATFALFRMPRREP
jgi:hypothetical protein